MCQKKMFLLKRYKNELKMSEKYSQKVQTIHPEQFSRTNSGRNLSRMVGAASNTASSIIEYQSFILWTFKLRYILQIFSLPLSIVSLSFHKTVKAETAASLPFRAPQPPPHFRKGIRNSLFVICSSRRHRLPKSPARFEYSIAKN